MRQDSDSQSNCISVVNNNLAENPSETGNVAFQVDSA